MAGLILTAISFTCFYTMTKTSVFCKDVQRGFKPSRIIDMDSLMDFHYSKAKEAQQESVARNYPLSEHFERWATSLNDLNTSGSDVMDHNDVPNRNLKLQHSYQDIADRFNSTLHITRHRSKGKSFLLTAPIRPRAHARQNFRSRPKRFFKSRKLHHLPKAGRFKKHPLQHFNWSRRHSKDHLVNVTKRDVSSRRIKLSDILSRAGLKKNKEDAIKVVLPLLLSDLKEIPNKEDNLLSPSNVESKGDVLSPIISTSNSKQRARILKNFKVKSDDGKEFSFSVSAPDVQQLMNMLAKPNSSIVLERVTVDKHGSLKSQIDGAKPERQGIPSSLKSKDDQAEALSLKEFETSVFEKVLQLDVPWKPSKTTTRCTESMEGDDLT